MQSYTHTHAPAAQAVKIFSPAEQLPQALAEMDTQTLWANIQKARGLIAHHKDIANNGDESAAAYYFYIPSVARDMNNARYTLTIMYAELQRSAAAQD